MPSITSSRWVGGMISSCVRLAGILAVAATLVVALNWESLNYYFVTDDFALMEAARAPLSVGIPHHFTPGPGEQYRPLAQYGYFWLVGGSFGLNSFLWHVANMVLHVLVVAVASTVIRQILSTWLGTATATIYFAIHSSLFLVFAWVAIAGEIWITLFALGTLAAYLQYLRGGHPVWVAISTISAVLALLSKEMAVSVPIIAVAAQVLFRPSQFRIGGFPILLKWSSAPFIGIWIGYLLLVRRVQGVPDAGPYAPQIDMGMVWTYLTYAWWTVDIARLRDFPPDLWLAFVALVIIGLVAWAIVQRDRVVLFGLAWFTIGIGPVLVFPDHMFHYYLYWPLGGAAIVLGALVERGLAMSRSETLQYAGVALLLGALVLGNYRGVQFQHDHDMTMMQAEQGERVLEVIQSENPNLPDGATLYFIEPASHVFYLMGYGAALRLYYPDTELNVYFDGHIPPPDDMSEPIIVYQWDEYTVVNVTDDERED
jgi:hypothetical protein